MPDPSASEEWWENFEALLERDRSWPSEYLFKFIVPREGLDDLKAVFGEHPVVVRASSRGRYVSVTAHIEMTSSADVVAVYREAGEVPGVISL